MVRDTQVSGESGSAWALGLDVCSHGPSRHNGWELEPEWEQDHVGGGHAGSRVQGLG